MVAFFRKRRRRVLKDETSSTGCSNDSNIADSLLVAQVGYPGNTVCTEPSVKCGKNTSVIPATGTIDYADSKLDHDNPTSVQIVDIALKAAEAVMKPKLDRIGFSFRSISSRYARLDAEGDRAYEEGCFPVACQKYEESLLLKHRSLLMYTTAEERNTALAEMATTINNLTYMKQLRGDEAYQLPSVILRSYESVLLMKQYVHGPRHMSVGTTWNNIGSVHFLEGNNFKAIISYRKARKILRIHFGLEHLDICTVSANIGDVFYRLQQWKQAATEYRAALSLRWIILGQKDPKVARLMEKLAETEMKTIFESKDQKDSTNNPSDEDQLSDDGSFVKEVEQLQSEIDDDMEFFSFLEEQAPRELIHDKTSVFKELRELKDVTGGDAQPKTTVDDDSSSSDCEDSLIKDEVNMAKQRGNEHCINNEQPTQAKNVSCDFITQNVVNDPESPWQPPETIARQLEMLTECALDLENLAKSSSSVEDQQLEYSSTFSLNCQAVDETISSLLSDDFDIFKSTWGEDYAEETLCGSETDDEVSGGETSEDDSIPRPPISPLPALSALCSVAVLVRQGQCRNPDEKFGVSENDQQFSDTSRANAETIGSSGGSRELGIFPIEEEDASKQQEPFENKARLDERIRCSEMQHNSNIQQTKEGKGIDHTCHVSEVSEAEQNDTQIDFPTASATDDISAVNSISPISVVPALCSVAVLINQGLRRSEGEKHEGSIVESAASGNVRSESRTRCADSLISETSGLDDWQGIGSHPSQQRFVENASGHPTSVEEKKLDMPDCTADESRRINLESTQGMTAHFDDFCPQDDSRSETSLVETLETHSRLALPQLHGVATLCGVAVLINQGLNKSHGGQGDLNADSEQELHEGEVIQVPSGGACLPLDPVQDLHESVMVATSGGSVCRDNSLISNSYLVSPRPAPMEQRTSTLQQCSMWPTEEAKKDRPDDNNREIVVGRYLETAVLPEQERKDAQENVRSEASPSTIPFNPKPLLSPTPAVCTESHNSCRSDSLNPNSPTAHCSTSIATESTSTAGMEEYTFQLPKAQQLSNLASCLTLETTQSSEYSFSSTISSAESSMEEHASCDPKQHEKLSPQESMDASSISPSTTPTLISGSTTAKSEFLHFTTDDDATEFSGNAISPNYSIIHPSPAASTPPPNQLLKPLSAYTKLTLRRDNKSHRFSRQHRADVEVVSLSNEQRHQALEDVRKRLATLRQQKALSTHTQNGTP